RVTTFAVDNGKDLAQVWSKQFRSKLTFSSIHPVDVAAQRIDLAVVTEVTIRMSPGPIWKSVGTEARVDERQPRFQQRINQVGVEIHQLISRQHSFVDDGSRRQTGNVEHAPFVYPTLRTFAHALANHVQLAFKRQVVF